ncbi:MAG: glycosyltransferase family 39 protein, partial [Chloroflexota bacterium]
GIIAPVNRKAIVKASMYLLLIAILLIPRVAALDSFSTLDEPYWLSMGANFYYALGQREFENTVYEYQPAVTTMWIVTGAMLGYFPQYRGLGQGYLDMEKAQLDPFMLEYGKDPLALLSLARLIQVLVVTFLFLLLYYLLQFFIPSVTAFFVVLFASFDPFFLGQSRLLDHEAMLSLFGLISVLSLAIFLTQKRSHLFLILSAVAAGLAQLTKSSAIAILVPVGVLLLIQLIQERQNGLSKALLNLIKVFGIWLVVLIVTYVVFWPGMWVAPGKMLYEVYGNAFSYALQGARLKVTSELTPSEFRLSNSLAEIWALFSVVLWRTTPLTWLGTLAGFSIPFTRDRELVRSYRQLATLSVVTALAFILMFSLAQGRNSPHYVLSSYLALNVLAGLGWFHLIKWTLKSVPVIQYSALFALIFIQAWSAVSFYPYYYTYRNPILYSLGQYRDFPQFPYGEGLELAAQYLASQPDAENSVSLVYFYRGCFSYFYPGTSIGFRPFWVDGEHDEDLVNAVQNADYVVVYYALQGNLDKYADYVKALSRVEPIHEVWLDGYKYVEIYRVDDFPPAVFEDLAQ